jgi:hypothetical protein
MKLSIISFAIVMLGLSTNTFGQQDTTWNKWNWIVGEWVGEGSGTPGQALGWFSLQPDLDGKILVRKNHSEYPATPDKPKSIHDDLMIVYPAESGEAKKAIYFDNEGHVINYVITYSEKSIIFTSEKIFNSPIFRLIYFSLDNETINVKFEMSQDGEKFITYTEGKCRKKN